MYKLLNFIFIIVLLSNTACSTIMNTSKRKMRIKASPEGAVIKVLDNEEKIISEKENKMTILLDRAKFLRPQSYKIIIEKEGYQKVEIPLIPKLDKERYIVGNIFPIPWTLVGWLIVDPLNGGMWVYESDYKFEENMKKEDFERRYLYNVEIRLNKLNNESLKN